MVLGASVALASCSGGSSSTPGTSGSTSTTPSASSTSSTTAPTAPGSTTSTCQVNVLSLSQTGRGGAAGTIETTFGFRNTSNSSCTLSGFPGAEMLDSSGKPLATQTTVRGGNYSFTNFPAARVTLAPGTTAYFNLGYSDVPTGNETSCPSSAELEVTPPNDYTQLTVAFQATACNHGTLVVSPVFAAGSSASQTTAPSGG